MKRILLLLISIHASTCATNLTISEAIAAAKKHRPNLQALEYKIREEQLKVKEAWTGYLPKLQVISSLETTSKQGVDFSSGFGGGLNAGVQAQQLIYQFGGPQQQAKIAQAGVGVAQYDKITQEQAVAYEVTKTFIDCWVLQQQQDLITQLEASSKRTFEHSKQERNVKILDKQDFLNSVEARTLANEQVVNFQEDASLAQAQLVFLLGNNHGINLVDKAVGNPTTLIFNPLLLSTNNRESVKTFVSKALKNRPELKSFDKKIEAERHAATQAKLSAAPSISLTGNSMHTGASKKGQFAGGISFSWPVFDGSRSRYLEQEANARATAAMLQKEQTAQQIILEVNQAYFSYNKSLNGQQTRRITMKRAESLFYRREQDRKLGLITQTTLEEARYGLLQAKNNWLLAQADVAQKEALLQYRCGQIS
jgi:outer membrane protein TolC